MESQENNNVLSATTITVALGIGATILIYYYNKHIYSYWQRRGISGPSGWPILGTYGLELIANRPLLLKLWRQKYGKVYGIYQGTRPALVIADAEVLKQVCIKDFDIFPNHDDNVDFPFLFFLKDDHWRRVRALMSPTFTSGKMKRMFKSLDACADDLLRCFDEKLVPQMSTLTGREEKTAIVNVKDTYNLYTLDTISTCCYGLKLERSKGSTTNHQTARTRDDLVKLAMKGFSFSLARFLLFFMIPEFILKLVKFKRSSDNNFAGVTKLIKQLIDIRRKSSSSSSNKYDDYLQLLLDAKLDDQMDLNDMDLKENHHAGLTKESIEADQKKLVDNVTKNNSKQTLTEPEILINAMFLLLVGMETTSTLLSNCTYLLAFHPNVQHRLYEEVKKIAEYKDKDKSKTLFTYESITSCQYLDSVISETLRLFSPVLQVDNVANQDYMIDKYNIRIEKGTKVVLAYYTIMNDPDYWPEPDKFDPERFMPANKDKIVSGSYCPFGIGPRYCIGMRFSLTEAKLALAKVIMNYRFKPAPGTEMPPIWALSMNLTNMKKPHVTFINRNHADYQFSWMT